jgi:hypothetical protein
MAQEKVGKYKVGARSVIVNGKVREAGSTAYGSRETFAPLVASGQVVEVVDEQASKPSDAK